MTNITQFLKSQVDNHETPSVHYAFFDTEGTIFELKYGSKQVKTNEPVSDSTMYHLFSVTKTFTALAVLQLVQSGKVALDRPVSEYLPSFTYPHDITVAQLLSHTAGTPNPLPLRWIHLEEEHRYFERDHFFAGIFQEHPKLVFKPGTEFKYSNLGYVVLGQLIEQVSGQTYEDYVRTNILRRAGIDSSEISFRLDTSLHATGYQKRWSIGNLLLDILIDKRKFMGVHEGRWKPFRPFYNNGIAYGGLFGSARGLIKYAQALMKSDSVLLDERHKQILFAETVVGGNGTGMSMSWFTGSLKRNRFVSHAGGGGGYYVELRVYPELGVGSVILYNRSGMRDERILDKTDAYFITEAVK
jgi:CubicO group peptidase (beta-lactamase class C family)